MQCVTGGLFILLKDVALSAQQEIDKKSDDPPQETNSCAKWTSLALIHYEIAAEIYCRVKCH